MEHASVWAALVLGILLGMRHALDPDHVVAVSTIVSEYRNPLRALWVGLSWGLGHTTTLFGAGLAVLALGFVIPDRLALAFEAAVGAMLVFLGLQVLWKFRKRRVHTHPHPSREREHQHYHAHQAPPAPGEHHGVPRVGQPFFRLKSFVIGTIHGMAGSAALMLIVLTTLKSVWVGVSYILLFGAGTMLSMGLVTVVISLPFTASARLPVFNRLVQVGAGVFSIAFGAFIMYQNGIAEGLLRFGG